ncbi:MAG TPA: hypothetical protein DCM05_04995 [Elusimicrobia bacterium]|nr:hypothetical protein [Elusimicrobiota bacterium]
MACHWIDLRTVFALCALLGSAQAFVLWRFRRRLRPAPAEAGPFPALSVIVPFKGLSPGLEDSVRSMLGQDYPGKIEYLFVAASRQDAAYAKLEGLLAGSGAEARLLESQAVPVRCGEKNLNLIHAVSKASPGSQLLLFADSDLRVPSDWARRLAAPLKDPRVGAATMLMLYVPATWRLSDILRSVWIGAGLPFFCATPPPCGQSLAMRRRDYERLGVAAVWERCVTDDSCLEGVFKRAGLRVTAVPAALPHSRGSCTLPGLLALSSRWFFVSRIHTPRAWLPMAGTLLAKLWIVLWALRAPVSWGLLAAELAVDTTYAFSVFWTLSMRFPGYFTGAGPGPRLMPILAALAMPVVFLIYLSNLAASLFLRGFRWGGYHYRVRGSQDVEVLG